MTDSNGEEGVLTGPLILPAADARSVFLTDMARCEPASALSEVPRRGLWRTISYRTETFSGRMLVAGDETNPPEVSYPLEITGWHRIWVGVFQERWDELGSVQVKLTDDPAFSVLTVPSGPRPVFRDVYWKTADLTGRRIHFRQLRCAWDGDDRADVARLPGRRARIAYLRLDPLSEAEVDAFRADQADRSLKRLYAHDDANGYLWLYGARSAEDIQRELEPYRESDFSRIYWEAGMGDTIMYLGTAGRVPTCDGIEDFKQVNNRMHTENWRWFREVGMDPFRIALEYAHEIGLEFHASYRPAGFYFPPFDDEWNAGGLYERRPDLRAINRDGSVAPRISFSFPETRLVVLAILREVAEYGVDGIAMLYIRRPPLVGYEPPLVEGFRQATGLDARELPEDDPPWLRYRCHVLNGFMRELRTEMDAVAREQGRSRSIEITAMVSARQEENLRHGMDVAAWVAEGTVDTLIPYTTAPALDSAAESWPDPSDASEWIELVRGTATRVSFSILPRWMTPEAYRKVARALYEQGAESLFFWDCGGQRVNFMDQFAWNAMRSLGHRDELLRAPEPQLDPRAAIAAARTTMMAIPIGDPSDEVPTRPVLELGGYDMGFGTPG
jgi:hypothetical protein